MTKFLNVGGMEMTDREYKTLKYIIHFIGEDPLHQPPSHRQVFDALNQQGEKLISTEQTMRVAYSLRKKGLIVDLPANDGDAIRRNRNLVPTAAALKLMKKTPVEIA